MAELALGAVHSLLGLLREEAQRLSRVQGDVQFIKEEMESMNSFLLHQANMVPPDGDHDEQVRTWMKQVRDLAFDCSNCIDLYVQRRQGPEDPRVAVGLRHCIPWLPWFVRSLVAQHRAASQIRELKERAREVGERRLRYGVEPPKPKADGDEKKQDHPTVGWAVAIRADAGAGAGDDDLSNLENSVRFAQDCGRGEMPPILEECTEKLLRWLKDVTTFKEWPRVMFIAAPGTRDGDDVARQAWHNPSAESLFERKVWLCTAAWVAILGCWGVLRGILWELDIQEDEKLQKARDDYTEEKLEEEIRKHLQDKRSLIVLDGFSYTGLWEIMQKHLRTLGCAAGSAVIVTTKVPVKEAKQLCAEPIIYSLVNFFGRRARTVVDRNYHRPNVYLRKNVRDILREIQERCEPNAFCMRMFVHALYADPNKTEEELTRFRRMLVEGEGSVKYSNARRVLTFCYNDLPRAYKACLLYLAIFPRHQQLRRSRLVGRWAVEGFTARRDWPRTVRAAERAFDVLLNRGFVYPGRIGVAGKVKSCVVHHHQLLEELVVELAKEENFVDTRVSYHLAQHFSTQSGLRLRRSDNITKFLHSPAEYSPLYRQLKVLDLEGCDILGKTKPQQHQCLKNICNILLLRYLSLRNIDVTHLPKEIEHLQQLEVLDIRGTKVPASATRDVLLPKLKRLLAGRIDRSPSSGDTITADESFSTIMMPRRIDKMTNMEVLSHVGAPRDAAQLEGISDLWMLRKLGMVIPDSEDHLNKLLKVISNLNECLRSLSIRINGSKGTSPADIRPEKLKTSPNLESLSLSGITSGQLLQLFAKDDHSKYLAKVTLHDTRLNRDDLSVVGKLPNLRGLRIRHKSYNEEQLVFSNDEFQNLMFLVVEGCSGIAAIRFGEGAAPALEKIVWSFTNMEPSLLGLLNLPKVKEIEFNGGPVPDQLHRDIENHKNRPVIRLDHQHNHREGTGRAAAVP